MFYSLSIAAQVVVGVVCLAVCSGLAKTQANEADPKKTSLSAGRFKAVSRSRQHIPLSTLDLNSHFAFVTQDIALVDPSTITLLTHSFRAPGSASILQVTPNTRLPSSSPTSDLFNCTVARKQSHYSHSNLPVHTFWSATTFAALAHTP